MEMPPPCSATPFLPRPRFDSALARRLNFTACLEPADGNPYLVKYYNEPKRYGLPMQLWLLKQRFVMMSKALGAVLEGRCEGIVLDRSIFSDIVFAKLNYDDGNISSEGYDAYTKSRNALLGELPTLC